jgi:kynurenine formamidase
VGRAVLLDLPRFTRQPWLDDDTRIGPADLDLCAEASGVTIERGDIVLIRTGKLRCCRETGSWNRLQSGPNPGLSVRCAHWIYDREIAALGIDAADVEARPRETECHSPLQMIAVRNSGLLVGTMFDLDLLADACAADRNYAFLFVAPPLPGTEADRSRVNPIAIK